MSGAAQEGGPAEAADGPHTALIVAVARDADRTAFGELFEHFGPRLKSYFLRAGVSVARAEELAQEAMLTVWRKAEYFDPDRGSATTWIFVIARNLRIDSLRRERGGTSSIDDIGEIVDDGERIDDTVAKSQRAERVRAALAHLSDEQAAVIRLSFFTDTPHAEISEKLGIPLGTVKSRIRLATARLRELLSDI